ncbi:MAG: SIS domain-containing protein [Kiloniellales bacterium]
MPGFDCDRFIDDAFGAHAALVAATREAVRAPLARLVELAARAVEQGGKILFFGNGVSAGVAQQLAAALTVRQRESRAPIAALALSSNSATLTAIGNALGFDQLFVRQIRALGRRGDLAVGLCAAERSTNVTLGLEAARNVGLVPAAFTGSDGGDLAGIADPLLMVPSDDGARILEMHVTIGQIFCAALERRLGLVRDPA